MPKFLTESVVLLAALIIVCVSCLVGIYIRETNETERERLAADARAEIREIRTENLRKETVPHAD